MAAESFQKVAIIGPGLIGASMGLALKRRGLAQEIIGYARRITTLESALRIGAVDGCATTLEKVLNGADLVVLATPVLATITLIEQIGRHLDLLNYSGKKPLITDACSTKTEIVEAASHLSDQVDFIGGHPMAGSENSGPEHAQADLFEGATWIFTPHSQAAFDALPRMEGVAQALGAKPLVLTPQLHDRIVAAVSHLPHLLSVTLMREAATLAEACPETWEVAATGFRDMTRLAGGSAELWRDICLSNSIAIADALAAYRQRLERLEELVRSHQGDELATLLQEAQEQREQLNQPKE